MRESIRTAPEDKAALLRLARPELLEIAGYEPVEPIETVAREYGIPTDQIAKLDGNENLYGPAPAVVEAVARSVLEIYSDPDQRSLREALEVYTGLPNRMIVAGHGSDELIDLVGRALLANGDRILECTPTFGMYRFTAAVCGAEVINVPRRDDFSLNLAAIERAIDQRTKAIFLPSPNNPTGNLLSRRELDACLSLGPAVVVDEAYIEFAGMEFSYAPLVAERENLIVLRTFSKWAGLAGLRLGYGLMPVAFADLLRVIKPPYTPNVASEVAGVASLQHREELMLRVREILAERDRLMVALKEVPYLTPLPSSGNFILCRVAGGQAELLRDRLRERGVFVRYFDDPAIRDCIRISVARPHESRLLLEALARVAP
jgi:histidinol-phosphate aminotransferase